jgi:futalosine hydrolase
MLLVAVATEKEIKPIHQYLSSAEHMDILVTGMGPVQSAASLSSYLALHVTDIDGVLNVGIGGAYVDSGLEILDICLAQQEIFGDFGICMQDDIIDFDPELSRLSNPLISDDILTVNCKKVLDDKHIEYKEANFVTVNCCSGTKMRGEFLRQKFAAGCENMEGAAVAMVCKTFKIPSVEIRCISNMVEDRNTADWKLEEAIEKICKITELFLKENVYP